MKISGIFENPTNFHLLISGIFENLRVTNENFLFRVFIAYLVHHLDYICQRLRLLCYLNNFYVLFWLHWLSCYFSYISQLCTNNMSQNEMSWATSFRANTMIFSCIQVIGFDTWSISLSPDFSLFWWNFLGPTAGLSSSDLLPKSSLKTS